MHWSKLQANVALSSGEAELNAASKGISELVGVLETCMELRLSLVASVKTDASVCKSMLLRHGSGRVKHLTTKQLWCQGAVERYGIRVIKISRDVNGADLLTHGCSVSDLKKHMKALNQYGFSITVGAKGGCRNVEY